MDFKIIFEENNLWFLLTGVKATIFYTIVGFILSMIIGCIVALGQLSKLKSVKIIALDFVEVSPNYDDVGGTTCYLAARLISDFLGFLTKEIERNEKLD